MTVRASSGRSKWEAGRPSLLRYWPIVAVTVLVCAGVGAFFVFSGSFGFFGTTEEIVETASGRIIRVPAGGSLQSALNRAAGGDTIELQAGAFYKEVVKLPNKAGAEFITIRTSAPDSDLPPAGTRLDPKKYGRLLPKIVPNVKGEPAVLAVNGAHHYRFIGVEFGPTIEGYYNVIQMATTEETSVDQLPHHIEFDRVYVHGSPVHGQRRGIAANGRHIKITNSWFSDFKREGEESQAIAVWAADGPIEIVNNYLEAAGECILFGGAESTLKLNPGNAIVRDNHMNKPLEWRGTKWVVKNFFEIKNGRRIKVENNLMTNNWVMGQEGHAIVFFPANDSGPHAVVEDVEFVNNIVRGSSSAVTVAGGEASGGRRLTIRNNVFEDISAKKWEGRGFFLKPTTWQDLVIENNTVIHDGSIVLAYGEPIHGMVFRNNIVFNNEYGFHGDGVGVGRPVVARYFPQSVLTNNIIVGGKSSDYGGGNFYPTSIAQIGFVGNGDYRLRPESQFAKKGIGANLDPGTVGGNQH